jgi:hypothetical protein
MNDPNSPKYWNRDMVQAQQTMQDMAGMQGQASNQLQGTLSSAPQQAPPQLPMQQPFMPQPGRPNPYLDLMQQRRSTI